MHQPHRSTSLNQLRPGQRGTVAAIHGDPALSARLKALGIRPGLPVTMVRRAPWGCPVEVSVRSVHVALRRDDLDAIQLA